MRPEEFSALANVEREHWFYRGKRDIVRRWLSRLAPLERDDLVVDVGAGTGQLLVELQGVCRAVGIEYDPVGLEIASTRSTHLLRSSILALPLRDGCASVVTAMDVIEHVDDDTGAVEELARVTRPGGLIFILVPAFQFLWSDWDESLGHKRRYTKAMLMKLIDPARLRVRQAAYVNSAVFLPILFYRAARTRLSRGGGRLEDQVPHPLINRLLHACFVVPACWSWFTPPFGVSILCIVEKLGRLKGG